MVIYMITTIKMKEKIYIVIYDNGFGFEYSLFKSLEWAKKEWQRIYDEYGFDDLEKWEVERKWEYEINDIYDWCRLNLKQVYVNP